MGKKKNRKGFTLLEVLVSVFIFFLMWMAAAASIMGSRYLSSFVKHKVQAIYWAQRTLEEQRRVPFPSPVPSPFPCVMAASNSIVSLDTKGTFNTTADDLQGNLIVTTTYLDAYRKRVLVEVNWTERILGGSLVIRKYCTTNIAKEPQLN